MRNNILCGHGQWKKLKSCVLVAHPRPQHLQWQCGAVSKQKMQLRLQQLACWLPFVWCLFSNEYDDSPCDAAEWFWWGAIGRAVKLCISTIPNSNMRSLLQCL